MTNEGYRAGIAVTPFEPEAIHPPAATGGHAPSSSSASIRCIVCRQVDKALVAGSAVAIHRCHFGSQGSTQAAGPSIANTAGQAVPTSHPAGAHSPSIASTRHRPTPASIARIASAAPGHPSRMSRSGGMERRRYAQCTRAEAPSQLPGAKAVCPASGTQPDSISASDSDSNAESGPGISRSKTPGSQGWFWLCHADTPSGAKAVGHLGSLWGGVQ